MSKVYATKRFHFEACHHLPGHSGKCANIHGHSYKLEVTVCSVKVLNVRGLTPDANMVMDFSNIKAIVNAAVVNKYDHQDLNKFFDMPTAEQMVVSMYHDIKQALADYDNVVLEEVKLWETEDSFATFRG